VGVAGAFGQSLEDFIRYGFDTPKLASALLQKRQSSTF
jgi:hypothetical protein